MHVSLIIPEGIGPFPVLMGPGLIGGFGNWAPAILRHGFITASYTGNDANDDSRAIGSLYPQFDFGTLRPCLMVVTASWPKAQSVTARSVSASERLP